MLIGDIAKVNARRFKSRIAYKDERTEVSFDRVNKRCNALVHGLLKLGLKKGDRVAVLLYNCVEYSELIFALPKAGFILVPLNYRLVGRELEFIIDNSEASALVYGDEFQDVVAEIRPRLDSVSSYIEINRKGDSRGDSLDFDQMTNDNSTSEIQADISETDTAYILYTSGTTGRPKGAMLTHKNIITNLYNLLFELQPQPGQKIFNLAPLYHCAGQNQSMAYFFYGNPHVTIKQFDPEKTLDWIQAEKPSVLHLVPAMQNMVMNHPHVGKTDTHSVELMMYGASSIMRSHLERSMEIFGCRFIQFAGQTEGGPGLTCLRPEDHVIDGPESVTRRLGSAGKELKLTEVKIVDESGKECPPDTPGEQIARGDNIMKGYWKMEEATAKTVVDGWLRTGDICMRDDAGFVYYVDRIKDMINRGGENVYPREIEEVIATHPSVMEVAGIGIPDTRVGEEIMAVIAPKNGASVTKEEIVRLCEKNLADFKKARQIELVDELPKNATGKVLKRVLREKWG
ncbi:MAG: long-chain-fatty-acid--CoA ligase [Proteobacteria bacterium]|nr:long-chain-fatty-acid--CoA ligase [Pseudomonadota bacterium]